MSSAGRGRGGKFSKPKRGGGKHFSRDLRPLNADGEVEGMWGDPVAKVDEESSEEEEDEDEEEESSEDEDAPPKEEMTREQRRAAAKARKEAAIARQKAKNVAPGDLPSSSEDEDDEEMPANPNHTASARSQIAKPSASTEVPPPAAAKTTDLSQLSRREREALQAQQAKERYQKLHAEGKTDEARADLERLRLVREKREAEAARKKAEAEERAEQEKSKAEQMARENRLREAAMGTPGKKGRGRGKK